MTLLQRFEVGQERSCSVIAACTETYDFLKDAGGVFVGVPPVPHSDEVYFEVKMGGTCNDTHNCRAAFAICINKTCTCRHEKIMGSATGEIEVVAFLLDIILSSSFLGTKCSKKIPKHIWMTMQCMLNSTAAKTVCDEMMLLSQLRLNPAQFNKNMFNRRTAHSKSTAKIVQMEINSFPN
uniref:EB domain-containing protein n=1 Tax=Romanomermis culicivorax TaxID=13658 RepID=A0A915JWB9_ROMCU